MPGSKQHCPPPPRPVRGGGPKFTHPEEMARMTEYYPTGTTPPRRRMAGDADEAGHDSGSQGSGI